MKRRKLIDLESYSIHKKGYLDKFQKELFERLEPTIFEYKTEYDLCYAALKFIKPINKSVNYNKQSIIKGVEKVLLHFRLNKQGMITSMKSYESGKQESNDELRPPLELFQEYILVMDMIPGYELDKLFPEVKSDLLYVNGLIKHYESLKDIKVFLTDGNKRKNIESSLIVDLYIRCLKERQAILDYYLEGIYIRVLKKCKFHPFKDILSAYRILETDDFPYELGKGIFAQTLDYKKLDEVTHRIRMLPIDDEVDYYSLYQNNKGKFYKVVFKATPVKEIFEEIFHYLTYLPTNIERKKIFMELKKLFDKKNWLAFYALGLPQVEGLFAEMVEAVDNKSSSRRLNFLPEKVNKMRDVVSPYDNHLDYFQYCLPKKRNSLAHSGISSNDKLVAYDILTDLSYVLQQFATIESPLVTVNRLIKAKGEFSFFDLEQYVTLFNALESLHNDYLKDKKLNSELNSFFQFVKGEKIDAFIERRFLLEKLDDHPNELDNLIFEELSKYEIPRDWRKVNDAKIESLSKDDKFIHSAESVFYNLNTKKKLEEIINIEITISGMLRYIYNDVVPSNHQLLFEVWKKKKKQIKWLKRFKERFDTL